MFQLVVVIQLYLIHQVLQSIHGITGQLVLNKVVCVLCILMEHWWEHIITHLLLLDHHLDHLPSDVKMIQVPKLLTDTLTISRSITRLVPMILGRLCRVLPPRRSFLSRSHVIPRARPYRFQRERMVSIRVRMVVRRGR